MNVYQQSCVVCNLFFLIFFIFIVYIIFIEKKWFLYLKMLWKALQLKTTILLASLFVVSKVF